jgi:hypothetical protein
MYGLATSILDVFAAKNAVVKIHSQLQIKPHTCLHKNIMVYTHLTCCALPFQKDIVLLLSFTQRQMSFLTYNKRHKESIISDENHVLCSKTEI